MHQRARFLALPIIFILWLFSQAPALADNVYLLNPGDKLEINVWEEEKLKQEVVVKPDGTISFPLVGHVTAAGKTTDEVAIALRERLSQYIPDAEININLLAAEGSVVYVTGEVTKSGAYVMKGPLYATQAISMAGGLTEFAKKNSILILRIEADGRTSSLPFRYGDVEDGEDTQSNILLQSGDTIIVP